MNKKTITLEDGQAVGWFDADAAHLIEEGDWWNGSDRISLATGSQWNHERLAITAKGAYIICAWSNQSGIGSTNEPITAAQAAVWLMKNETADEEIEKLPDAIREELKKHIADAER